MPTLLTELDRRIWANARPPKHLSLAEWADAHFMLPAGDANAGRWHTLPYQREIMDAMSDPRIERLSFMKSARVGFTKIFCAAVGYYMEHDACPILIVQPAIEDAQKHSKEDLAPMLRDVPVLRGLVAEPKSRDSGNTISDKAFRGGSLSLIGANSPRGFRRTSRRVVIFDEIDGYPRSAGDEGDPYELGVRRSEYYWNRKIIAGSTPKLAGFSKIEALFLEGDQRRRYLPCPHCGAFQVLKFENLRWPDKRPEAAHFVCSANGCVIENSDKRAMDAAGEWRAEAPDHFTPEHRHASFHLWAAYSYSPNASWGQLATEWVKAAHGGQTTVQTYINTVRGETFTAKDQAPEWEQLYRRREPYAIGTVPWGVLLLTAGVDVQKDRLVAEVVGWGRGKTSWSIDYLIIPGDTSDMTAGPWAQLDALLARTYPHPGGTDLTIRMLAVDSGYNTQTVYAWARRYPMSRVIAIKGQESGGVLVSPPTAVDMTGRGKAPKRGYKVWPVCGHVAKSELYGFLRLERPTDGSAPPPGYVHFPEYDESYFRELTAEQLLARHNRKGYVKLEWTLIPNRQNHALDCFDSETEVLTKDGWRRFEVLKGTEELATVNLPTDAIEYQTPSALIARPYEGEMLHLRGRKLDILVTPDHRMVTTRRVWAPTRRALETSRPEITPATQLTSNHAIKCSATWWAPAAEPITLPVIRRGEARQVIPLDPGDFAEFLGWVISDGWISSMTRPKWRRRGTFTARTVTISQNPGIKSDGIAALLRRLPWRFSHGKNNKYVIASKALYEYIAREMGAGAFEKRVPQWIKDAPAEIIERFVDAAMLGDGWTVTTSSGKKIRFYSTISRQLADDMQELLLKLGRAANVARRDRAPVSIQGYRPSVAQREYIVTESRVSARSLKSGRHFIGRWVPYVGMVYCATVENGTLICRRNGRAFIAGNCRVYARAAAAVLGLDRSRESDWRALEIALGDVPLPPTPAEPAMVRPLEGSGRPAPGPPSWLSPRPGWLGGR